jgi:hypothetical protein
MLPQEIADAEVLFRAVPKKPHMWKKAEERPSSAVFKDSKGISVDRDGGRSENEVCRFIVQRKSDLFAVIGLSQLENVAHYKHILFLNRFLRRILFTPKYMIHQQR